MSGAVVLDEVHCLWPSCSHSCCWQSEQRIREGHPKTLKTGPNNKPLKQSCTECRFPVFTLVDATNWIEEGFISWMALSRETLSQKPLPNTEQRPAQMNQNKKTAKAAVDAVAQENLSIQVFPSEDWMPPRSPVETHSPTPSSSPRSSSAQAATDHEDPILKRRAFKKTDTRLSRQIFQSPRRLDQNNAELFIRGITPPQNSKQSSLASSTVELNSVRL